MANETIPLFQTVGGALDSATATFVSDSVTRLVHTIYPWALASVTLYVTFYAFMLMTSRLREPVWDGLLKCAKIMMISALALNADTYLTWVVETLQGFEASMTAAVLGREDVTLWEALDGALDSGFSLVQICTLRAIDAGWMHIGAMCVWLMAGIIIALSFGLMVIAGGAMIFIASALLKIVFALGPFFLLCLMFPMTRSWFDGWFGKAITYIFQIIVVACLMAISLRVYEQIISFIDLSSASDQNVLKVALMLDGTALLLYWCMRESSRFAGDLGGRVAVEALSAAGIAYSVATPARTARNLVNPTSTRLDPTTGRQVTASRLEHVAMGRTVAAPAYRQVLLENMRNGWKKPPGGSIQPSSSAPAASSRPAPGSRQALLERLRSYGGQPPPRGDS